MSKIAWNEWFEIGWKKMKKTSLNISWNCMKKKNIFKLDKIIMQTLLKRIM